MAITLTESAKLSQTQLQRGVIETFILESPIFDRIPFLEIQGNAYAYNQEGTLPGVEFRAVNGAYTESTGTVNQATETLVILGGDADVDTFIQQTRSNLNDQRATQTKMKVKSAVYKYQDTFINGDTAVDANAFDGLKKRLTGTSVIDAATNGLGIVTTGHDFLDVLDAAIVQVQGTPETTVIYTNNLVKGKLQSSIRRLGGWQTYRDVETGKIVETYNGFRIADIGNTAAGARILPQTETMGSSSVTSSIYVVRYGEDEGDGGVTGLTNGGIQVRDLGEVDDKPALRTRIEFFCGMAVFSGRAAVRIRGVLNS